MSYKYNYEHHQPDASCKGGFSSHECIIQDSLVSMPYHTAEREESIFLWLGKTTKDKDNEWKKLLFFPT